jgi:hypothetical protein
MVESIAAIVRFPPGKLKKNVSRDGDCHNKR